MVTGSYQLHEIFLHHVGIFALHGAFDIHINNALGSDLRPYVVINKLGVVLGTHACKGLSFRLRYSQTVKGVLDILGHVFPVVLHLCVGADVCGNVVNVQSFK